MDTEYSYYHDGRYTDNAERQYTSDDMTPGNLSIPELAIAGPLTGSEQFEIAQNGQSANLTLAQIAAYVGISGGVLNCNTLQVENATLTWSGSTPNQANVLQLLSIAKGASTAGFTPINYFNINLDEINSPGGNVYGWFFRQFVGGSNAYGNRIALASHVVMTSKTHNMFLGTGGGSYCGLSGESDGNANDGGTGLTPSTSSGGAQGANILARLAAAATYWYGLQGLELDIQASAGSSMCYKVGLQISQLNTDAVAGALYDGAFNITNQSGAIGWSTGITFGACSNGVFPLTTTGTAILAQSDYVTYNTANPPNTIANFIDAHTLTITGNFLSGPGFSVNGAGGITATLPTSSAGLTTGQMWRNGNVVNII